MIGGTLPRWLSEESESGHRVKPCLGRPPWRVRRVSSPCGHCAGRGLAPIAPGGGVTCPSHSGSGWNCQRPRPSPLTSSPSVAKAVLPSLSLRGQVWGRCLRLSPSLSSWCFRSTPAATSLLQMHQGGSILTCCPVTCSQGKPSCPAEPAGKEFQTLCLGSLHSYCFLVSGGLRFT